MSDTVENIDMAAVRKNSAREAAKLGARTAGALTLAFFKAPIRDVWRPYRAVFENDEDLRALYRNETPTSVLLGALIKPVFYAASAALLVSTAASGPVGLLVGVPVFAALLAGCRYVGGMLASTVNDNEYELDGQLKALFIDDRTGPLLKECAEMNNDWEAWATRKYQATQPAMAQPQ